MDARGSPGLSGCEDAFLNRRRFPLLAALRRASHFVGEGSVGQRLGEMHA
jgi:hypothetical protein